MKKYPKDFETWMARATWPQRRREAWETRELEQFAWSAWRASRHRIRKTTEPKKVWVLTRQYYDYDRHGEYFVAVFANKPTKIKLETCGVPPGRVTQVLNGGERNGSEFCWYELKRDELK